jgi:ATP-dependent Clp protease ATP-binding subunit ClpA
MGRCARIAWDHAVYAHRTAEIKRPGVMTGHILLGVLREETCAGGLILGRMGLDLKHAVALTEWVLVYGRRKDGVVEQPVDYCGVPHTPAARRVLDLSVDEANHYTATYPIGTEHLLLALFRVPEGMGNYILRFLGLDEAAVRATRDALWEVLASPE